MFSIESSYLLHGKVQNYVSSKKWAPLCIHQLQRQIGRSTVFWRKIKPLCVCYENRIMHWQKSYFSYPTKKSWHYTRSRWAGQVQRHWSISRKPAIENMMVTMVHVLLAPWRALAMSEWHSHVLQIWALQMFIWRHCNFAPSDHAFLHSAEAWIKLRRSLQWFNVINYSPRLLLEFSSLSNIWVATIHMNCQSSSLWSWWSYVCVVPSYNISLLNCLKLFSFQFCHIKHVPTCPQHVTISFGIYQNRNMVTRLNFMLQNKL